MSFIKDLFDNFFDKVIEFLKRLIIPKEGFFKSYEDKLKTLMKNKFGVDFNSFKIYDLLAIGQTDTSLEDVYYDVNVNGRLMNLKIFDTKYLYQGVYFFRPLIRGFTILMVFLFNLNSVMKFFGAPLISKDNSPSLHEFKTGR